MTVKTISILGAGNVAWHLYHAFTKAKDVELVQIYNRTPQALNDYDANKRLTDISQLKPADIYIIAVNDDSIEKVASSIKHTNALIVHTSGAKSIHVLSQIKRAGVFYPLQTFTKGVDVNFSKLPICIEATTESDAKLLEQVGLKISTKVFMVDTEQRKTLHLSAVFVNNFGNYLSVIAEDLCQKNNLPFNILHELIKETARKAIVNSPRDSQTGPAKRGDIKTIEQHLKQLENTDYQSLYKLVTSQVLKNYGKKL